MATLLKALVFYSIALGAVATSTPTISERTPTTGYACITAKPRPKICGVLGNVDDTVKLIKTISAAHFEHCRDACINLHGRCHSLGYDGNNSSCSLYGAPLSKSNIEANSNGVQLYSRDCFTCAKSCGNVGIQYAEYHNTERHTHRGKYLFFDPAVFKTDNPHFHGVTYAMGGFNSKRGRYVPPLYGNPTEFGTQLFIINHRGYIHVPASGSYNITTLGDDVAFVWLGENAYSGWTKHNYDMRVTYSAQSLLVSLTKGDYVPFRVLYANAGGDYAFPFSFVGPDGTELIGSKTPPTDSIVQFSCDGTTAPAFPPFGQET